MGNQFVKTMKWKNVNPFQDPPKGYGMAFVRISDMDGFQTYLKSVQSSIIVCGGRIVAKTMMDPSDPLAPLAKSSEAEDYTYAVLLDFPSPEEAVSWYNSKDYQAILLSRTKHSTGPLTIVSANPGCSNRHASAYCFGFVKAGEDFSAFAEAAEETLKQFEGECLVATTLPAQVGFSEATTATDFGACYVFSFPTATKAVGFKHKLSANVDGPLVVASNFENH